MFVADLSSSCSVGARERRDTTRRTHVCEGHLWLTAFPEEDVEKCERDGIVDIVLAVVG